MPKYIVTNKRLILEVDSRLQFGYRYKYSHDSVKVIGRTKLLSEETFDTYREANIFASIIPHKIISEVFLTKYGVDDVYFDYYYNNNIMGKKLMNVLHKNHKSKHDEYEIMALLYLKRAIMIEIHIND